MRVKQIVSRVPAVSSACSKLRLFWDRVTATRLTTLYFIFSIIHCFVQAFIQGDAFVVNADAAAFLSNIVVQGNATQPDGFFVWQHKELRFCDYVPVIVDASECLLVWKQGQAVNTASLSASGSSQSYDYTSSSLPVGFASAPAASATSSSVSSPGPASVVIPSPAAPPSPVPTTASATSSSAKAATTAIILTAADDDNDDGNDDDGDDDDVVLVLPTRRHLTVQTLAINLNGSLPIVLNGWGYNGQQVTLSEKCLNALNWPVQRLDDTKREDIAFTSFQFWVLGMSIVALLNESIPHIIASLLTHLSATAWGAFQLAQTEDFHRDFTSLVTDGVCEINLLPTYWKARSNVEIPSLVLNCIALLVSIFLSWRLIKSFGWQTFKRVGASRAVNRVYKLVLTLSVTIQLCMYFVLAAVALWLDQICNGAIGRFATGHKLYQALLVLVLVCLPIWLTAGWFAVRREWMNWMNVFLFLCMGYMVGWGAMFDSTTFRWTFVQWSFFAVLLVLSVSLVSICFVVGIFCRLNFGRGLPHYLNAEEALPGDDFIRVDPGEKDKESDPEKIDFPANFGGVPTFEDAFDDDVPPPPGARALGPRFYMHDNAALAVDAAQLAGPAQVSVEQFGPPPTYAASRSISTVTGASSTSSAQSTPEVTQPSPVHSRTGSDWTAHSGLPSSVRPLVRKGSDRSYTSSRSAGSTHSAETSVSMSKEMRPRWVIE